jgi:hypothetical protein
MSSPISGLGPPGDITAAEQALVVESFALLQQSNIKVSDQKDNIDESLELLDAFKESVYVENVHLYGLRAEYEKAKEIMTGMQERYVILEDYGSQVEALVDEAKILLGYGEDLIQQRLNTIKGEGDEVGLMDLIAEEEEAIAADFEALEELITTVNDEVAEFNDKAVVVETSIDEVVMAEAYVRAMYHGMVKGSFSFDDGVGKSVEDAYKAIVGLVADSEYEAMYREKNNVPESQVVTLTEQDKEKLILSSEYFSGKYKEAQRLTSWDNAVAALDNIKTLSSAAQGTAVGQKDAIKALDFKTEFFTTWGTYVAPGLFEVDGDAITLKPAEDYDAISQAMYVELVNLIHGFEDAIKDGTAFDETEKDKFWGLLQTDGVTHNTGDDVSEAREENINGWQTDQTLNTLDISSPDLNLISNIVKKITQMQQLAGSASVSPDLAVHMKWVVNVASPLRAAYDDFLKGATPAQKLLKEEVLKDTFTTWVKAGGVAYIFELKHGIAQVGEGANATRLRPSIQDLIFFEYASTGEASLNRTIGELGDIMDRLNDYLGALNTIDALFARSNLNVNRTGKIKDIDKNNWSTTDVDNLRGAFTTLYDQWNLSAGDAETAEGADVGALNSAQKKEIGRLFQYAYTYLELDALSVAGIDPDASDQVGELATRKADFEGANGNGGKLAIAKSKFFVGNANETEQDKPGVAFAAVFTILGNSNNDAETKDKIYKLFNDEAFQLHLTNSINHGQSVNDTAKQNLKKTMFIYQEFIKSAGTVMDKVSEMIKGMASRIGR